MDFRILQLDSMQALQLAKYLDYVVRKRDCILIELELECPSDSSAAYLVDSLDYNYPL